MAETFGSGIDGNIVQQLNARTKLFSERKDPKQLQAINSNSAWIKVRSSVNIAGDNSKAKEFILSNSGNREGIGTAKNSLYTVNNRLGFRPAPGITDFKVASKNTYGTLQEATINFNVWTLEDLEAAEQLYFRPGYSVLVEWGHSAYISNSNQIKFTNTDTILKPSQWFNSRTYLNIENDIKTLRDTYDGNYEGFLGLIVNFSWSYRNDGGYDCSIKVVSKNVVLESISIRSASELLSNSGTSLNPDEKQNGQETEAYKKSPFHLYFSALQSYETYRIKRNDTTSRGSLGASGTGLEEEFVEVLDISKFSLKKALQQKYKDNINFYKDAIDYFVYRLLVPTPSRSTNTYQVPSIHYVPLRAILDIYNNHVALKNSNGTPNLIPFDLDSEEKYFTFPEHYSALPYEAIMLKQPKPQDRMGPDPFGYKYENFYIESFLSQNLVSITPNPDRILNLHISTTMVLEEIDKVISKPNEEGIGVLEAFKGILSRIEVALGEINDFDIVATSNNSKLKIIDRKRLDPREAGTLKSEINLTGLGSTIVDLSISSAISSNIASQIAIAAQAPSKATKSNVGNLLRWNKLLTDRHSIDKLVYTDSQKVSNTDKIGEGVTTTELYKNLNSSLKKRSWTFEDWDNLLQQNIENIKKLAQAPYILGDEFIDIVPGVVPVELSLKMLGLGGFKVGTTFRINKGILPAKYNEFGYIITGVEQEIGTDNKWYTSIKTQFFVIKN